jgi:hypothetical protein
LCPHISIADEFHLRCFWVSDHDLIFVSTIWTITLKTIAGVIVLGVAAMTTVCGVIAG